MGSPDPRTLKHRVVVVAGASRGIGAAADGAAVALLAKTQTPNPKIAGTLAEVAEREEGRDDLSGYLLAPSEEDLTPNFYLLSAPVPTV